MKGDPIITDRVLTAFVFDSYYLFKQQFINERREASNVVFQNFLCKHREESQKAAKVQWNVMTPYSRQPHCIKLENYDALFSTMKDTIITKFNKYTNMTYEHVSN